MKKAIVCGSFDPFTIGHLDIVKKASDIFDEVHVVIAINANKKRKFDTEQMVQGIKDALLEENINNCVVVSFDGLVAEYCKDNDITYFVRGLRNSMDYNYEENIAEVNKLINPNLEYVYFRADHVAISSSMIRELMGFGRDVSKYVPKAILKLIDPDYYNLLYVKN